MKTATLPSLRVDPELREAAESVLQEGETLSGFIEASVRETIERRRTRAEFIARGLTPPRRSEADGRLPRRRRCPRATCREAGLGQGEAAEEGAEAGTYVSFVVRFSASARHD